MFDGSGVIHRSSTFAAPSVLFIKCWERVPGDVYDVESSVPSSLDLIYEVIR